MSGGIKNELLKGIIANAPASEIKIAVKATSRELNRARDEENAVVAAIKANDLLHRDVSNYLLRDIVRATIKVLNERRAERVGSDPT